MAKKKEDILNEEIAVETKAAEVADEEIAIEEPEVTVPDEPEATAPVAPDDVIDIDDDTPEDYSDEIVLANDSEVMKTLKVKIALIGAGVAVAGIVAGVCAYLFFKRKK